ncbi:MAG: ABC transporter permease, partial [Pseudomonadota bacterium]
EGGAGLLYGWLPRAPLGVLMRHALRETFQRWVFLLLILSALIAGTTQISVFSSVIRGADSLVDQAFTAGSRLNRLQIKPRRADMRSDERFPIAAEVASWPNVEHVERRLQTITRLVNKREEEISYVSMGLHDGDPEYGLLEFLAGGPFTAGADQLEIIVTASLLTDFFDLPEAGGEGFYDQFIGRTLPMRLNRYMPGGKLRDQIPVSLRIVGVIFSAEGGRQMYVPGRTQVAFYRATADKSGAVGLPVTADGAAWTVDAAEIRALSDEPWEDGLHVYTAGVREILPVIRALSESGYKPKSDIWDFKWALDVQDIAWRIFTPLLILIVLAVSLTVIANIWTAAKLREREFALWRILGMRRGDLAVTQISAAVISVATGALLGLGVAQLVVSQSRRFLAEQHPDKDFSLIFSPVGDFFWLIAGGALLVGIVASLAPAVRTASVDPAKVLQS